MKIMGLINFIFPGLMSKIFYSLAAMRAYSVQTYFLHALKLPLPITI